MLKLLLADDHGLYRRGLRFALEEKLGAAVVLEADALDSALSVLGGDDQVDLAVFDLLMPGLRSVADLKEIRQKFSQTRFVVLSALDSSDVVLGSLAAGLHGYISKAQPADDIVAAIEDILAGRIYVPPWLSQASIATVAAARSGQGPRPAVHPDSFLRLTPRQQDVLALLAEGLSNKEIADRLSIAETTTKIHVASLMRVLSVRNRTEAALLLKAWIGSRDTDDVLALRSPGREPARF